MNESNITISKQLPADKVLNEDEVYNYFTPKKQRILLLMVLLVLCEFTVQMLERLKNKYYKFKLLNYIDPTIIITSIGLIAGFYLTYYDERQLLSDLKNGFSQIFLIILLPPIIFESAVNMKAGPVFENFGSIIMYSIPGTLIAIIVTSIIIYLVGLTELITQLPLKIVLTYASIISATDPVAVLSLFKQLNVNQNLYALIFGESILNDAVSIICYDSMIKICVNSDITLFGGIQNFLIVFCVSILIGYIVGVFSAIILKFKSVHHKEGQLGYDQTRIETTLVLLVPWVTYLIAESYGMSGIVSIIFCGISMARYAVPNLDTEGEKLMNSFYHSLAYNFENLVFLFIGIGFIGFNLSWEKTGVGLIITTFVAIILGRYANIYIITQICNKYRTVTIISQEWQHVMFHSGLRGAMAYALSLESTKLFQDEGYGSIMLNITLTIVIFNIYIQGPFLYFMVKKYDLADKNESQLKTINDSTIFNQIKNGISRLDQRILIMHLVKQKYFYNDEYRTPDTQLDREFELENDLKNDSLAEPKELESSRF